MGTSEVHLPEGENLIGLEELHFLSLFFTFFLQSHCPYSTDSPLPLAERGGFFAARNRG